MSIHKSQYPPGYRSVSQLARFIGVTPERIKQMVKHKDIPEPEKVLEDGTRLWSTKQAKAIQEWQLGKRQAPARRQLPPTARMYRENVRGTTRRS